MGLIDRVALSDHSRDRGGADSIGIRGGGQDWGRLDRCQGGGAAGVGPTRSVSGGHRHVCGYIRTPARVSKRDLNGKGALAMSARPEPPFQKC